MSELERLICTEAAQHGWMPFERFMELALYHPAYGYYERGRDRVGRSGDFMTSVSVGSAFGELLAFQFGEWLEEMAGASSGRLQVVEAGAHDGTLAADLIQSFRGIRPRLAERLEYWIIEPSERRRQWQQETLRAFGECRWFPDWPSARAVRGVIFANELLDAFPVRRLGWDAVGQGWFEWGIRCVGGAPEWDRRPGARELGWIDDLPREWLRQLPDGYSMELNLTAERWWEEASSKLERGRVVAIDYGYTMDELAGVYRPEGTLRAYRRHGVSSDLLAAPGEQDLTAHVNFTAIQKAGELRGLATERCERQEGFLSRILGRMAKVDSARAAEWMRARAGQIKTLLHPEHLGRSFRVLVQSRGVS